MRRYFALGAIAAFLAACSSHSAAPPGSAQVFLPAPALGVAAKAQHWSITVGAEKRKGELESLDFYPNKIVIDAGDSITWHYGASVHTVSFLGPGMSVYKAPTTPAGGSTVDGTAFVSSGVQPPGSTYTLTFPKAGKYPYYCLLHPPEMAGMVIVHPAGKHYPHPQAWYNGFAKADMTSDLDAALQSISTFPFKNGGMAIAAGIAPGLTFAKPVQPTVYAFLDGNKPGDTTATVKVGAVVTWVDLANNEPHTVTFPVAGKPLPKRLVKNPFSPPEGGFVYDGTHVTNSGIIGNGFPTTSYALKFTKAGTYTYYCLLHFPFGMIGKIVVKP